MIASILKTRSSTGSIIEYNEAKVRRGEATLAGYRNLPSDLPPEILDVFERLENNPALRNNFTGKSFHMTVGPAEDEDISHEKGVEICDRIMKEMGYGDQPYLIYRHNDIDREHYHIVSTRIDVKTLKEIKEYHEGRQLMKILEKIGPEYGFKKGRGREALAAEEQSMRAAPPSKAKNPLFNPKAPDMLRNMASLLKRALKYEIHSLTQIQAVLAAMNVRLSVRTGKDGKNALMIRGLDKSGKAATKPVSVRKVLGEDGMAAVNRRIAETEALADTKVVHKIAIGTKSAWSMQEAKSAEQYTDLMRQFGLFPSFIRNRRKEEGSGPIDEVLIVDTANDTILDTAWKNEIRLEDFRKAEADRKRWGARSRTRIRLSEKDRMDVEAIAEARQREYLGSQENTAETMGENMERQGTLFNI